VPAVVDVNEPLARAQIEESANGCVKDGHRDGLSGQDLESKCELLLNEDALIGRNAGTQGRARSLKSQNPEEIFQMAW